MHQMYAVCVFYVSWILAVISDILCNQKQELCSRIICSMYTLVPRFVLCKAISSLGAWSSPHVAWKCVVRPNLEAGRFPEHFCACVVFIYLLNSQDL